jgi:hypothetical protein
MLLPCIMCDFEPHGKTRVLITIRNDIGVVIPRYRIDNSPSVNHPQLMLKNVIVLFFPETITSTVRRIIEKSNSCMT